MSRGKRLKEIETIYANTRKDAIRTIMAKPETTRFGTAQALNDAREVMLCALRDLESADGATDDDRAWVTWARSKFLTIEPGAKAAEIWREEETRCEYCKCSPCRGCARAVAEFEADQERQRRSAIDAEGDDDQPFGSDVVGRL